MEKRKVFKISIIDKEISRTEFDRNTFYTSDSELTLVFKLIERDYTYDHGEILLYNVDDESFVTRKITKQENDFVYEIESDIIPHYGTWKSQLQLINEGDVYTSKPFEFTIENDLSNLAPQPTLTDINNWSTLKQSSAELIDEMQDIIVDVEQAESERESKEKLRQQTELERLSKENSRQHAESERVNNEKKRRSAEFERVNNEKKRRSAEFERVNKENSRQQAESERQTTFETAEQKRQSSEAIRIENENQRKTDHANRSAELDSKADKIVLKNLTSPPTQVPYAKDFEGNTSDVWYASIEARYIQYNSGRTRLTLRNYGNSNNPTVVEFKSQVSENFEYYSLQASGKINGTRLLMSSDLSPDLEIEVRNLIVLNLTEIFGAGNEPNKEEIDELIKVIGYIDGEYALDNKEMLIWTLALVRRNKNAIITLGGTI